MAESSRHHSFGIGWISLAGAVEFDPRLSSSYHQYSPGFLPRFGGKGMYGMKVHEAVKDAQETQTGITIHEVDENYDEGRTLFQAVCDIDITDTPVEIAAKVQRLEHLHYPRVIESWITQR
jgi:phosphoribosylglycinamide formyltransferase-1